MGSIDTQDTPLTWNQLRLRWILGLGCMCLEVLVVGLVITACVRVIGGDVLFFWHPVLLSIGLILFLSHGVRVYTSLVGLSRTTMRITHGVFSGLWVCLALAGLIIIEIVKQQNNKPHFTSVHGRLGLAVLFFSLIQGVAGSVKFFVLYRTNKRFLRWHGRMGTLIYASALTTMLTGVMSKLEPHQLEISVLIYMLTAILGVTVLFFDFWVKRADLIPERTEVEGTIRMPGDRLFLVINDEQALPKTDD